MFQFFRLFFFILATSITFPAFATTYYASPLGSPGLNGLSPATATTLDYAIQTLAQTGDKVFIGPGQYHQPDTIFIRHGITLIATQPRSVLINGLQNADPIFQVDLLNPTDSVSFIGFQMSNAISAISNRNPGSITLSNMVFNNHRGYTVYLGVSQDGDYKSLIKNCRFLDNRLGIYNDNNNYSNQNSLVVKHSIFRNNDSDIMVSIPDSDLPQRFLVEHSQFFNSEVSIGLNIKSQNTSLQDISIYGNRFEDILAQDINIIVRGFNFTPPGRSNISIKHNTLLRSSNAITISGSLDFVGPKVMIAANLIDQPISMGITVQEATADVINNIISNAGTPEFPANTQILRLPIIPL
jgi:hypothetical protein